MQRQLVAVYRIGATAKYYELHTAKPILLTNVLSKGDGSAWWIGMTADQDFMAGQVPAAGEFDRQVSVSSAPGLRLYPDAAVDKARRLWATVPYPAGSGGSQLVRIGLNGDRAAWLIAQLSTAAISAFTGIVGATADGSIVAAHNGVQIYIIKPFYQ